MKAMLWLALACLLSSCSIAPAIAQEIETGTMLICDTGAQLERYAKVMEGDFETAIEQVNAEVKLASGKDNACGVVSVAFVRGEKVGSLRDHLGHAFNIAEIRIVAVMLPIGWRPLPEPWVQFTTFKAPGSDI